MKNFLCTLVLFTVSTCAFAQEYETFVDLGLPSGLLWSKANLYAPTQKDWGVWFGWGEITDAGKGNYIEDTYHHFMKQNIPDEDGFDVFNEGYTKYVPTYSEIGFNGYTDGKNVLENSDDVANVLFGENCHIPTKSEWEELFNYCQWEFKSVSGVNGYKITGPNNNFIFLPSAAYRSGYSWIRTNQWGHYWTSTLDSSNPKKAFCIVINEREHNIQTTERFYGLTIRAVLPQSNISGMNNIDIKNEQSTVKKCVKNGRIYIRKGIHLYQLDGTTID